MYGKVTLQLTSITTTESIQWIDLHPSKSHKAQVCFVLFCFLNLTKNKTK